MKRRFKQHIVELSRYQTSVGRDLESGLRMDRNERVSDLPAKTVADIFRRFPPYSMSASPEVSPFYEKIAKSIDIGRDKIYVTNGITEGVRILYEVLSNPGDNVVVLDPTYPMYQIYAKMYRTEYRKFAYKSDLSPDMESLYRNMDKDTALVMIPNPNLPVESVFTVEEIRRIADRCKANGAALVVDEAYHFFGAPSVIDLIKEYDNLVVMRSFSKAYGLAGIRLGYMVSNKENIKYLSKTRSLVESNTFSMGIASYMLDHPDIMRDHVSEVKEGARYLQAGLTRLGLRWFGGNFTNGMLIFLHDKAESMELVSYLKERKIYIRGAFEAPYDNCVRVSIGAPEIMRIFIKSLSDWMKEKKSYDNNKAVSR